MMSPLRVGMLPYLPRYLLLCAIAVLCVFPFWWTLVTALSSSGNVLDFPPTLWPRAPTLANFAEVFRVIPIGGSYLNSILIMLCTVGWKLLICSMAAYPLAKLRFNGARLVFALILATNVLPSEVNFLVNFITVARLGLIEAYSGVIMPNIVTAVSILLLKQAFEEVSQDLIDAARLDGASEWRLFTRILLPLTAPWLASVAILAAVEAWNDYIWPSIVMSKPDNFPLVVGVRYLSGTFGSSTRVVAAGTTLTVLPMLLVFGFTQRFFMRGMEGAVK